MYDNTDFEWADSCSKPQRRIGTVICHYLRTLYCSIIFRGIARPSSSPPIEWLNSTIFYPLVNWHGMDHDYIIGKSTIHRQFSISRFVYQTVIRGCWWCWWYGDTYDDETLPAVLNDPPAHVISHATSRQTLLIALQHVQYICCTHLHTLYKYT